MKHLLFIFRLTLSVVVANQTTAQQTDSIAYVLDSAYARSPFCANILLTKQGKTVIEKSYGYADAKSKQPLTPEHSIQIASISKQFTAYGIMLLQHKGALQYDSTVNQYLPSFPYTNITLRHLLTHTSGLPNFWDTIRPYMDTTRSNGNREMLTYLINHPLPLQFEPGSKFDYCDIGYDLLALVIEQVSGKSYDVFLASAIFKPLGMKHSFAYQVTDIRKIHNTQLAIGHVSQNGVFEYAHLFPKNNFVFYLGGFYGDGSVVSTARDLAIWDQALKNCTLLTCLEQQVSTTSYIMNNGSAEIDTGLGYGFGWFIKQTPKGKVIYHTGFHPGNVSMVYRLVDLDRCFIMLANAETPNLRALRTRIIQLLQ
jgi:CubicO group peptidase (beta-lactamase class C family)